MNVLIKHQILQRQQILFHNRKNREFLNITNSFEVAFQIILAKKIMTHIMLHFTDAQSAFLADQRWPYFKRSAKIQDQFRNYSS